MKRAFTLFLTLFALMAILPGSAMAGRGKKPSPPRHNQPAPVAQPAPAAPAAPTSGDVAAAGGNGRISFDFQGVVIANVGSAQVAVSGSASTSGNCSQSRGRLICSGSFSVTGQFSLSASGSNLNFSAVGRGKVSFSGVRGSTSVNGQAPIAWSNRSQTVQVGR